MAPKHWVARATSDFTLFMQMLSRLSRLADGAKKKKKLMKEKGTLLLKFAVQVIVRALSHCSIEIKRASLWLPHAWSQGEAELGARFTLQGKLAKSAVFGSDVSFIGYFKQCSRKLEENQTGVWLVHEVYGSDGRNYTKYGDTLISSWHCGSKYFSFYTGLHWHICVCGWHSLFEAFMCWCSKL